MTAVSTGDNPLVVRDLRWWDLAQVAELEQHLFPSSPWSLEVWWSELAGVPRSRHYVVAAGSDGLAGFAGLAVAGPDADVVTLAVAEQERGRGLGTRLLRTLLDEARRRRCRLVFLEVDAANAAARALYARHGFVDLDRRVGYYGPGRDALVMRRPVHGPAGS
jgi:ribosomal-protein-alanine N-acetyltransferase